LFAQAFEIFINFFAFFAVKKVFAVQSSLIHEFGIQGLTSKCFDET